MNTASSAHRTRIPARNVGVSEPLLSSEVLIVVGDMAGVSNVFVEIELELLVDGDCVSMVERVSLDDDSVS